MKTIVVKSEGDLKKAINSDANEIIIENAELAQKLKVIAQIKRKGPYFLAAVLAAIPLIPVTGGGSLLALNFVAGGSAVGISSVVIFMVTATSCITVISLLTDWEIVEIFGIFKLERKLK